MPTSPTLDRAQKVRYFLEGKISERSEEVERMRQAAGCFALLADVPDEGEMAHAPEEVLAAYKERYGIECSFGFLKDPLISSGRF